MSKNGYSVYVGKCLLPIAPQKIEVRTDNGSRTVSLIDGGEISILGKTKLKSIELSFIIPQIKYPFAVYPGGFKGAKYFIDYFNSLNGSGKPFQFIVSRSMPYGKPLYSENIKVFLEDLTVSEAAADGFDIRVRLRLREYLDRGVRTINIDPNSGTRCAVSSTRCPSSTRNKPITIGSSVIVNGRLYGSSYGDAPGQMRNNYRGKVNFINLKGSHPYHITTPSGGWLGWVKGEELTVEN